MDDTSQPATDVIEPSRWDDVQEIYTSVFTKSDLQKLPLSMPCPDIADIKSEDDWKKLAAALAADRTEADGESLEDIVYRNVFSQVPGAMHPVSAFLGQQLITAAGGVDKARDFRAQRTGDIDSELFGAIIKMVPDAAKRLAYGKQSEQPPAQAKKPGSPIVTIAYHDDDGKIRHRLGMACTHEHDPYLGLVSTTTIELHDLHPEHGFYFRYNSKVAEEKSRGFEPNKRVKSPIALYPAVNILLSTVQPAWKCHKGVLLLLLAMGCISRKKLIPFITRTTSGLLEGKHVYHAQDDMYLALTNKVDSYQARLHGNEARRSEIRALQREVDKRDAIIRQAETKKLCDDASLDRRTREADDLRTQLRDALDKLRSAPALQPAPRDDTELHAARDEVARLGLIVEQQRGLIAQQKADLVTAQTKLTAILAPEAGQAAEEQPEQTEVPTTFDQLEEWVAAEMSDGRVLIHARAIATAKQSGFHDPTLAYRAMLLLRDVYWPMKFDKDEGARARWKRALADLHLECSHTGRAAFTSKTAASYQVQVDGKSCTLDMHLKGNSSFDPKFSFRVYFACHKGRKQIVVGSMPTHLPNRESN